MLKLYCQIITLLLVFFNPLLHAACRVPNGASHYTYTLNMTLTIPANASQGPVGDVIAIPDGPSTSVGCDPGPSYGYITFATTQTLSGTPDVYKTNVPGIGIKVWDDLYNPPTIVGNSGTKWYTGPNMTLSWSGGWNIPSLKAQFYIIGPVTPGDVILSTPFVNGWISTSPTSGGQVYTQLTIAGSAHINSPSCDINNSLTPASVLLRPINANALPHQGDTGVDVYFAISLNCSPGTTVNLTLTDPNGGDQDNGVLYNDTGSGLAENVGVQLLLRKDGGSMQPTQLNKSITVGQSGSEEQYDIPMAARYYRTSDSAIVGGKVSASVIYELSYQ